MLLILMFLIIVAILVFDYIYFNKNVLHPCFLFTFSFFLLSIFAIPFICKWNLNLDIRTFLIIILGIVIFNIASMFFKNKKCDVDTKVDEIVISKYIEYFLIGFVLIFNIIYIIVLSNKIGIKIKGISSIEKILDSYSNLIKFQNDYSKIKLPFIITNIRVFIIGLGFWFSYVFIHNLVNFKKKNVLQIIIIILCIICSILTGSRGEAISVIVSFVVFLLYYYIYKYGNIKKSFYIKLLITFIVSLIAFTPLAKLMGRETGNNPVEYISIYCGAELKNLDLYIRENNMNNANSIFESQTLISINNTISKTKIIKNLKYKHINLPFRKVNKTNLGNVYTVYYPFLYDFGYIGLIVFTAIMAIISNYIFKNIKPYTYKNRYKSVFILGYGLISFTLLFSFFSNYFYDTIISMHFLRYIIIWLLCSAFLIKKIPNNE